MGPSLDDLPELRRAVLDRRSRLMAARRVQLDETRYRALDDSGLLAGARVIGAYAAVSGEPDPLPWRHISDGRKVALPRVEGASLVFHLVDGPNELAAGKWGILEPVVDRPVDPVDLDAIVVPLLVFDVTCARAGRGAGFYDRTLGPIAALKGQHRPVLVGIADGEDQIPAVPQHDGDVRLDAVATPSRIFRRS